MTFYRRPGFFGAVALIFATWVVAWVVLWSPLAGHGNVSLAWLYPIFSSFTFLLYGLDKGLATHNCWRISERTLHLFSLCGGWPGAWVAQRLFHHKTMKDSFQRMFWITVLFNTCLSIGLLAV